MSEATPLPGTQLLTIKNTAAKLDCSRRTVYQLLALGHLTKFTIGKRSTRIDADEVERFITAARQE